MTTDTAVEIPFAGPAATLGAEPPFKILRGKQPAAWKALIYGVPGVGKSSLGAYAPAPLFLDLENGLKWIDCAKTAHLTDLEEVKEALRYVIREADFKTAVIDTIDELEKMLSKRVVDGWNASNKTRVKTVADIPYGRGGELLVAEWKAVIEIFDKVVAAGKNVLLIGHQQVIKFENPSDANFDFYTVNVHKKVGPLVIAKLDAVLFAHYETIVKGDGEKGKAVATGKRVLNTEAGASYEAKNRFSLPPQISLERSPALFDLFK